MRHSRSGLLPGGRIRVRITIAVGAWVRIEVRDDGPADWSAAGLRDGNGPAAGAATAVTKPSVLAEDGRGLWLVSALSGGKAGSDGPGAALGAAAVVPGPRRR